MIEAVKHSELTPYKLKNTFLIVQNTWELKLKIFFLIWIRQPSHPRPPHPICRDLPVTPLGKLYKGPDSVGITPSVLFLDEPVSPDFGR